MLRLNRPILPHFASAYARSSFASKAEQFCFYFKQLSAPAANIFKQEALAAGAELIVSEGAIIGASGDAELIANRSQLKRLVHKLSLQPFGLKNIANKLSSHLNSSAPQRPALMQIINLNSNSFYQNSAHSWRDELLTCSCDYADIGACSSSPGRRYIGQSAELAALAPVFEFVRSAKIAPQLSIDTFSIQAASAALAAGFNIINDISANLKLAEMALKDGAYYVLMHSHRTYLAALLAGIRWDQFDKSQALKRLKMQPLSVILKIDEFFDRSLNKLAALGCDTSRVILDPGIGFAKSPEANLAIIAHMTHFRHFGLQLLEGSSAKKSLGPPEIAPYLAAQSTADIVRIHDAKTAKILIDFKERLNNL